MRERSLTLAELVVTLAIVEFLAVGGLLMWRLAVAREEARRIRCRRNLNALAKGFATYLNERGDGSPKLGAIPASFQPARPRASDDTRGTTNHGTGRWGGMNVMFFDAHVEWRTRREIDTQCAVGEQGGLLWRLRN